MLNAGRRRRQQQQRGGSGVAKDNNVVDPRFIGRKRKHKIVEWETVFLLFAFLLLVGLCGFILWQQPASSPPGQPSEPEQRMADLSVQERGLVTHNVTWDSIVAVSISLLWGLKHHTLLILLSYPGKLGLGLKNSGHGICNLVHDHSFLPYLWMVSLSYV